MWSSVAFLLPRWTGPPSLLSRLVYIVGNIKFVLMWIRKLILSYIFGHSGYVHREGRSFNMTIVQGPIERHKSHPAARVTGDGLTGTHDGWILDRIESVPKWSRKRRACAGLREASRRDKAMRSVPPFPFSIFYYCVAFCISQSTALVLYKLSGSLISVGTWTSIPVKTNVAGGRQWLLNVATNVFILLL